MRRLFLLVLLMNVTYIAWELGRPTQESPVVKVSNSRIPPLVLISEMVQAIQQPEKTVADSSKGNNEMVVAKKIEKKTAVVIKKTQVKSDKKIKETVAKEVAVREVVVKELVTEPHVDACYTLGPFRELDKLRVFTRQIINYVVDVSFRSREEQEISLFWVYLAPEKGSKAAHKLSKRLISNNIRDYYIITSGEKRNGVSLGHFKDKNRALSHAKSLKKLGFKPVVEPVFKTYVIYWLDYRNRKDVQIPPEIFDKYMAARMNKLNRACK